MRALRLRSFGGPEVLEVAEVAVPGPPRGDQILVRVHTAGVNRADILQRQGHYPAPPGSSPDILGLEFAGAVTASGPDVRDISVGDRVMGIVGGGAQAEYVLTSEPLAIRVPDVVSDIEAGGIPEAYITARDALYGLGSLASGERVLIHAVGSGVGIAALQLATARGCRVYGTSRSAEKLEKAKALGLDVEIDTTVIAFETVAEDIDVIIDFIGAPYLEKNLDALAPRGRLVVVSTLGGVSASISLRTLMTKRLSVAGTVLRSRSSVEKAGATREFVRDVVPLLASGAIKVPVDLVFTLEQAAEAHRYVEENKNFGKVVFKI
ncbi:MAG TPA: NAD(P)H-quinone oxidoreductase [Candidatus Eremiobacteraceae bacterium]|nr:NAD(P)H-quinone oxidoreductase [Candidatus Eremiobacteraceae bacterium]